MKIDWRHIIIIHHCESHLAHQLCTVISHLSHENPSHAIFLLLQPNTDSDGGFYNLWQLLGLQFADMTHTLSPVFAIHINSLCQSCGCVLRRQSRKTIMSSWPPVNHDIFAHDGFFNDEINLLKTYVRLCRIRKRVTWWMIVVYSVRINIKENILKSLRKLWQDFFSSAEPKYPFIRKLFVEHFSFRIILKYKHEYYSFDKWSKAKDLNP